MQLINNYLIFCFIFLKKTKQSKTILYFFMQSININEAIGNLPNPNPRKIN